MASTGQTATQAPQSVQVEASITYGEPSLIAVTGHSGRQDPQAMQSLEMTWAMKFSLRDVYNQYMLYVLVKQEKTPKYAACPAGLSPGKDQPWPCT
jgi:hypothetical protein